MNVLGIDTSHYANSLGIVGDGRILVDSIYEAKADALVKIMANIDSALRSTGITMADIHAIGVGLGPGSWTGIRVGVTVGKMLAYSTGRPVCGISTLEALAYEARHSGLLICSVIAAGTKDMMYAAFYRAADDRLHKVGEHYVGDIAGLAKLIKESVVIVGADADFCAEYISDMDIPNVDVEQIKGRPRGAVIASLAAARLKRGEKDDTLALTPLYLKESTARVFQKEPL